MHACMHVFFVRDFCFLASHWHTIPAAQRGFQGTSWIHNDCSLKASRQMAERLMLFNESKWLECTSVNVWLDCTTSPEPTGEGSLLVSQRSGWKLPWPSMTESLMRISLKPVRQGRTANSSWRPWGICLWSVPKSRTHHPSWTLIRALLI